jgi:hypothetical protein
LTRQNAKQLLRILELSHSEINQEEHREEEHNNRADGHDHQEDNFHEEDH